MTRLLVTLILLGASVLLSLNLSAVASVRALLVEPQATATAEPVEECQPIGSAEGQLLYFCENNYAPDCVWDPSPGLGAGVVDCDW